MIELNSTLVVLLLEVLFALFVAILWLLYNWRKTKTQSYSFAEQLVNNLDISEVERTEKLAALIIKNVPMEAQELKALLRDISVHEHALYRLIIQIFLKRDPELLNELQEYVYALAKPYCKMLKQNSGVPEDPNSAANSAALEQANKRIARLTSKNMVLTEQLEQALKTADTIAEEYSRVFGGTQEETELRESAKRMLRIFQDAMDSAKEKLVIPQMEEANL